jgi:hypothetical protein
MLKIETETLGEVAARQPVITTALRALLDEHGYGAAVRSTVQVTPFGTYLMDVRVIPNDEAAELLFGELVMAEVDGMPFSIEKATRYCALAGIDPYYLMSDVREAADAYLASCAAAELEVNA